MNVPVYAIVRKSTSDDSLVIVEEDGFDNSSFERVSAGVYRAFRSEVGVNELTIKASAQLAPGATGTALISYAKVIERVVSGDTYQGFEVGITNLAGTAIDARVIVEMVQS